jgi:very-short-patch-repair endonuclease
MGRPALTKAKTLRRARKLRREATEAETGLWAQLRGRGLADAKCRRQVPIGPFIVDFCAEEFRLLIELDGSQHSGTAYDDERGTWLATKGYCVLRFWNNDVFDNIEGVLDAVLDALKREQHEG